MKRLRLSFAALLAASSLAVVGSATTADAATDSFAVFGTALPATPMANERFRILFNISTSITREARLQTLSSGTWKTISTLADATDEARFLNVHSTKTRDYRVYVPKAVVNGRTYPSFASKGRTVRVASQTATAFATPNEQCGTLEEAEPVTMVAQFGPRRAGRTVTFEATGSQHATVTGRTDAAGNVAVSVPLTELGFFTTTITAAGFNGSAPHSVVVSYRSTEDLCNPDLGLIQRRLNVQTISGKSRTGCPSVQ